MPSAPGPFPAADTCCPGLGVGGRPPLRGCLGGPRPTCAAADADEVVPARGWPAATRAASRAPRPRLLSAARGARPRPLPPRGAPAPLSSPGGLGGALYSHPGLGFALMRNVINPEKRAERQERRRGGGEGEKSERSERHREFGSEIKKSPESDGPAGRRDASHPDVTHPARALAAARRGKWGGLAGRGAERRRGARGGRRGWGAGGAGEPGRERRGRGGWGGCACPGG